MRGGWGGGGGGELYHKEGNKSFLSLSPPLLSLFPSLRVENVFHPDLSSFLHAGTAAPTMRCTAATTASGCTIVAASSS